MKTATSAWGYGQSGQNRFGQFGAWLPAETIEGLICGRDHDALSLLAYLRANNGPWSDFAINQIDWPRLFGWGDKNASPLLETACSTVATWCWSNRHVNIAPRSINGPDARKFQGRRDNEKLNGTPLTLPALSWPGGSGRMLSG